MTIANAARELAEITYTRKLLSFENDVVVTKALEFCEPWRHLECDFALPCDLAPLREPSSRQNAKP